MHTRPSASAMTLRELRQMTNARSHSEDTEDLVMALIGYARARNLIRREDCVYMCNLLFDALRYEPDASFHPDFEAGQEKEADLEQILTALVHDACKRGVIEDTITERDLLDTRLMGCLTPRPSEVIDVFSERLREDPVKATDYLYRLSMETDYIRTDRIKKDRKWRVSTRYGDLDITINLSKPEKDPKAIAAAATRANGAYPNCLLCVENEGYAGRIDHPARQNLRMIPLSLAGEDWYLQYSPYVYYNEHCIVLSAKHEPMRIDETTFVRLLEFVERFPHYTIGSNADLPIVGGSILSHEHYQGGRYEFAMARASCRETFVFLGYEDVEAGIVDWPMSVIRINAEDPARLIRLAERIRSAWEHYDDPDLEILSHTGRTRHNTITPIARKRGARFELDLVLRNNRTSEAHPLGIFHPHAELHHIKKENIGLIEVMGLAVLPARLSQEINMMKQCILSGTDVSDVEALAPHAEWMRHSIMENDSIREALREPGGVDAAVLDAIFEQEIGMVFLEVLKHCGVYKDDAAGQNGFKRFIASCQR